jgi:alkylation response protein AidB-like acyl-CoA dehydrogenase
VNDGGASSDPMAALRRRVARTVAEVAAGRTSTRGGERELISALGSQGIFAERWQERDHRLGMAVLEEMAASGQFSWAVATGLHCEAVLGALEGGRSDELQQYRRAALTGEMIGCVAASEVTGGSDLGAVRTRAVRRGAGWRIDGEKSFVTLATAADFAVVLARAASSDSEDGLPAVFVVPKEGFEVLRVHPLHGTELDTARVRIAAEVPAGNLIGRAGTGIIEITRALTYERLGICAAVLGACRLAMSLTVARAHQRIQFGHRLIDHQVIRLRLAELHSERLALEARVHELAGQRSPSPRHVAGVKVLSARFGERCMSECMHIFGGEGYLADASPLGDLWRSIRIARLGGGTDEVMLELVAGDLHPDMERYGQMVHELGSSSDPGELGG